MGREAIVGNAPAVNSVRAVSEERRKESPY